MIDLYSLATKLNDVLGTDKYSVWLNTNAEPVDDGRIIVTMNAARIPFSYTTDELDAETITLTLTFDLPVAAEGVLLQERESTLMDIHKKLLGWREFEVEQASDNPNVPDTYKYTARFEQQAPSAPYVDEGVIKQQIVVGATGLAQNTNCKAVVGNFIKVAISKDDKTYTELLKVSRASNVQIATDNNIPLSDGKTTPEMIGISKIATKTLTFIYLGKDIEKEFLKIAEGDMTNINDTYWYKVTYPWMEPITQKFKILNVSTQDSAGVYLQYTLSVQVVE